ncbi:hypothetical protein [Nocardia sp. NPDC049149]|uniref:hypothetical protein n=1 Tax=Nocardia sp. NPDC049149 TaxID=3364315 RepID=UPI00371E9085
MNPVTRALEQVGKTLAHTFTRTGRALRKNNDDTVQPGLHGIAEHARAVDGAGLRRLGGIDPDGRQRTFSPRRVRSVELRGRTQVGETVLGEPREEYGTIGIDFSVAKESRTRHRYWAGAKRRDDDAYYPKEGRASAGKTPWSYEKLDLDEPFTATDGEGHAKQLAELLNRPHGASSGKAPFFSFSDTNGEEYLLRVRKWLGGSRIVRVSGEDYGAVVGHKMEQLQHKYDSRVGGMGPLFQGPVALLSEKPANGAAADAAAALHQSDIQRDIHTNNVPIRTHADIESKADEYRYEDETGYYPPNAVLSELRLDGDDGTSPGDTPWTVHPAPAKPPTTGVD